jgi:hypothetical protein
MFKTYLEWHMTFLRKKVIGDKLVLTMQGRSPPLASPAKAF